jgi:hypothetical protein
MAYISEADRKTLDHLLGKALLSEELRKDLLIRERRLMILSQLPLSSSTVHRVMSLSDMPEIEEFAAEIYKGIFVP